MSNKHTFRSTQKSGIPSDSFVIKSHSFDSVLSHKKYYNVVITGFSQTTSIFTKFIQRNRINVSSLSSFVSTGGSFVSRSSMTSASRVLSSVDNLRISFTSHNRILYLPVEQKNMGQATFISQNNITARSGERLIFTGQKVTMPEFVITANAIGLHYFYVSEWDSYFMSDLDVMDLSSMDYEVV